MYLRLEQGPMHTRSPSCARSTPWTSRLSFSGGADSEASKMSAVSSMDSASGLLADRASFLISVSTGRSAHPGRAMPNRFSPRRTTRGHPRGASTTPFSACACIVGHVEKASCTWSTSTSARPSLDRRPDLSTRFRRMSSSRCDTMADSTVHGPLGVPATMPTSLMACPPAMPQSATVGSPFSASTAWNVSANVTISPVTGFRVLSTPHSITMDCDMSFTGADHTAFIPACRSLNPSSDDVLTEP
mmetsp:Transcript_4078/g.13126  ORF Transcript_4078/g.13126 Transcript_4078/m.13126 type:complete len:245 (+) Transcript_4078:790-1524(+)